MGAPLPRSDLKSIMQRAQRYMQENRRFGGTTVSAPASGTDASGRPTITGPPSLDLQLRQYDNAAGAYYDKSRDAYKKRVQMAAGAQRGRAMAGLEQSYSRGTGGEFGGGERMQAQVELNRAANEQEMAALADFDMQINNLIAEGRMNVTLEQFDYTRQLALLERQGQLTWDIEQYRWEMQKDIATQQAWYGLVGDIFGAAGYYFGNRARANKT